LVSQVLTNNLISMPFYLPKEINTPLLPEFQAWTDVYGMIVDNPNGDTSGNGSLYTAHYVAGLAARALMTKQEKERLIQVYKNNMIIPGLFARAPSKLSDRQAHDDLFGIISADKILNPETRDFTKQIYNYGKNTYCNGVDELDHEQLLINVSTYNWLNRIFGKVRWVWNNVNPGRFHLSSWLGRRPELIATMQMTLKEDVNPFFWLYWAGIMLWTAYAPNKKDHDGYILKYHSALACEGYGLVTDWICKKLRLAVKRDFGDFGQLLGEYFNKPHPLVKLLKDVI
jgi:hypothetical protein